MRSAVTRRAILSGVVPLVPRTFIVCLLRRMRLDVAAGTAVRFEPGQSRTVGLVALAGDRKVYGFNARVMGPLKS